MDNEMIMHYGVKGMKWGVHRARSYAKKDAKEYARAKMYYGEGAGTRRKLINATVKERSKDPNYKKAFDEALTRQDMSKHAAKAKTERKVKDTTNQVKKTGKGIVNIVTGHPERLGASMAVAYAGYRFANKTGVDKVVVKTAKQTMSKIYNDAKTEYGRYKVKRMFGL